MDESKGSISKDKTPRNKNTLEFRELIDLLLQIEKCKGVNSRDVVKELLSEFLVKIIEHYPQDLSKIYYFLNYKLGPSYLTPDLEISFDKLEALVQKLFGVNENLLLTNLKQTGDLGQVAFELKKINEEMSTPQSVDKLKLYEIMNALEEAALEEESSKPNNNKINIIYSVLSRSDKDEMKYLIRFLEKNLKLGVSKNIILHSLSRAISKMLNKTFEKDVYKILIKSLNQMEDEDILFNHIIELIDKKANFYQLIELCHIRCGVPVNYELMESTTGVKTMIKAIGKRSFFCEYNYCGIRCQIHCVKDKILIFNKNFEDITQKYPEIAGYTSIFITKSKEKIKKEIKSFILDCVFLPYDKKNDRTLNVQEITFFPKEITLGKKEKPNHHICVFCHDILLFNGEILINKTLRDRRKLLESTFTETISVRFSKRIELEKYDKEEILDFMSDSALTRCNGIIGKVIDKNSEYTPGEKNFNWIKVNKGYYKAELDDLNFIVIGAKYGAGDKRRVYASVLLACYNEETDNYEAIIFANGGLKERQMGELYYVLKDYIIQYTPNNYKLGKYQPDVIFAPKVILQLKTFFVCLNQFSAVGYNQIYDNYGVSIRFPKILKIRDDNKRNQISTSEKIINLYNSQDFLKETEDNEHLTESEKSNA